MEIMGNMKEIEEALDRMAMEELNMMKILFENLLNNVCNRMRKMELAANG